MIVLYYLEKAYRAVKNFIFRKKKENDSSTEERDFIY
jgi:hypothetical protein